jgi:LysM repeat protein
VKRLHRASAWLIILLILALFLVACERPLQPDLTDESLTPDVQATLMPGEPGEPLASPTSPGAAYPGPAEDATPEPGEGQTPSTEEPGTEPAETAAPTATAQPEGDVIYTVVAGDTLGSIADQYGVSVEAIAQANNLANIHTLDVGQQLLIPLGGGEETPGATPEPEEPAGERVHIVQRGENLYRIGLQYGFTIQELATYNNLANPNNLEVGQQILIPPEGYTAP